MENKMNERKLLKGVMSLLTVSLLAITLVATTAHAARVDQSLASKINYAAAAGKLNDIIPDLECLRICSGTCPCTRDDSLIWHCFCVPAGDHNSKKQAKLLYTSEQMLQVKGKPEEEDSALLPYTECMKTCDYCACTKMWPPETNWCRCSNASRPKKSLDAVATQQVPKMKSDIFPFPVCPDECKSLCICNARVCICPNKPSAAVAIQQLPKMKSDIFPFPVCPDECESFCICNSRFCICPNKPSAAVAIQQVPKMKSDFFPFPVCPEDCKSLCICNAVTCMCSNDSELKKSAAVAVKEVPKVNSLTMSIKECIESCEGVCGCTLIYPPELAVCFCAHTIKSSTNTKAAEEVQVKGNKKSSNEEEYSGVIPYTECIKTCDNCACTLKWPPESNVCICIQNGMPKKPVAGLEAKELHKKLELLARPIEKTTRGLGGSFIPYAECIAKCSHECVICTFDFPTSLCWCSDFASVNSKKQSIKNSGGGDDKKMVLWTKAKVDETISYEECMNTCDLCACTLPYPPELARCICINPKHDEAASGKALPM